MDIQQLEAEYNQHKNLFQDFQTEVFGLVDSFFSVTDLDIAEVKQRRGIKTFDALKENFLVHGKYKDCESIFAIKDIAGTRVVCHCEDDLENAALMLQGEIKAHYSNVSLEPKGDENNHGKSRPSYRAYHLTFTKPATLEGKTVNIFCEIQIRTVMADAWAVQDRKYIYGRQVEGDAHDLTDAVATIMKGCEGLWTLVKSKSVSQGTGVSHSSPQSTPALAPNRLATSAAPVEWFSKNYKEAKSGFDSVKKPGYMEIKAFLPNAKINISKNNIKDGVRDSEIHTFGWPIAVLLEGGKPEYKPVPDADGIHATILTNDDWYGDGNVRQTFDYWAIKEDGSFYLLKSIFEDERRAGELFFNTRIVRITETLMFLRGLYTRFNVGADEQIRIEITHGGLKGRVLGSSTRNRLLHSSRTCHEEKVTTAITTTINEINADMVVVVEKFTNPLFEQFDFFQLSKDVLTDIVTNYLNGKVV